MEMDGEGGVSDGRGVESGCGADAAGVERWGGPRRVGGGAAGPPRVLASPKMVPARTRELDRARAAKKAAKNAAAAADAGSSEPPPWSSAGDDGGANRAGIGPGPETHLVERQGIDRLVEAGPDRCRGGGGKEWWIIEPLSAVLRRPRTWQGGHGFARQLDGRVLAVSGTWRGWFGRVRGAARLKMSAHCRKAASWMRNVGVVLALCTADAHEVISVTQWGKGTTD